MRRGHQAVSCERVEVGALGASGEDVELANARSSTLQREPSRRAELPSSVTSLTEMAADIGGLLSDWLRAALAGRDSLIRPSAVSRCAARCQPARE